MARYVHDRKRMKPLTEKRATGWPAGWLSRSLPCLSVAVSAVVGAGCDVGDQVCTDEFDFQDLDDNCPYGPPGGPQKQNAARAGCPTIDVDPGKPECATATFASVFPILVDATFGSGGNCSAAVGCHGNAADAQSGVFLPADDPNAFFENLAAYRNAADEPYIEANAPGPVSLAWMHCNVAGLPGGGSAMPPKSGFIEQASIDAVQLWMECGMTNDGAAPIGAGGGGGGAVGGAGVGGAAGVGGGI